MINVNESTRTTMHDVMKITEQNQHNFIEIRMQLNYFDQGHKFVIIAEH